MKLYLHHFNIYSSLCRFNDRFFLIPELCKDSCDIEFISKIKNKVVSGNGNDVEYTSDLILKDKSLMDDLINENKYVIFIAGYLPYIEENQFSHHDEWDPKLSLNDLCFLGWTINNGTDSAVTDGIFPIVVKETLENTKIVSQLELLQSSDLNKWGLLPNQEICKKYLDLNVNDITILVNGNKIETNWQPLAVYCDKYTLKKLENINVT
ncbi:hypothetical protein [Glaesserella sp.]|uniref:hypothetical protein n=1 Tax=Glaesserella sp. TaxID=2094731 RepID=UPI00359F64B5